MSALRNGFTRCLAVLLCVFTTLAPLDAAHARFVSVDPVQPDAQTGAQFNRYAYAEDNPYRFTDPDGRFPIMVPLFFGAGLLLTSGDANAPRPGERTRSMSAGDAAERFAGALPQGRLVSTGRTALGIAPVFGNPQNTRANGQETMHGPTSERVARRDANDADAAGVHMNQTLTTITGGTVNSPLRPDVATRRTSGKIDVTEVLSPRQDAAATAKKYQDALGDKAGTIMCINPDKC